MNPRLVKFAVELQTGDVEIKTEKQVEFKDSTTKLGCHIAKALSRDTTLITRLLIGFHLIFT